MKKKRILSLLALLGAAVSGANAQIAVSGEGNTFTFTMPAYDVEITTELWYKLDATKTFDENVADYGTQTDFFLDRTLTKDVWNTFTSPAAIASGDITTYFGAGAKVRCLSSSTLEDDVLTLNFAAATEIEAGKPYLVKPAAADVVEPTFTIADLSSATTLATETDHVDFIPTLGKQLVTGYTGFESDPRSVLFLNTSSTLIHPTVVNDSESADSYIKGFRGYFQLHNRVGGSADQARAFCINFGDGETTGVMPIRLENGSTIAGGAIYDLQGRKVQDPTRKGIYMMNGKKVVIK